MTQISWAFLFISYVIFFAVVVRIFLRENRTPASRIAWVLVVGSMPVIGVIIYILIGEVNPGRNYNRRSAKLIRELYKKYRDGAVGSWEKSKSHLNDKTYHNAFQYSTSIAQLEPTYGNTGRLMGNAQETIDAMIQDIDKAKKSFHGLYYIWLEDKTGTAFAEALMRAAKRGVKCRVLADGIGSRKIIKSDLWKRMIDEGVDARVALPTGGIFHILLSARFDLRNHRKITVIDNKITYVGSRNIADPEFIPKAKYAPWVDIMTRMEGPVAQQNNLLFMSDWLMASNESADEVFDDVKAKRSASGFVANVVPDGPTLRINAIPQLFESIFASAQKEIAITTPYFVPNEGLVDAICAASYSGIDVKLNLPMRNDSFIVGATCKSYYKELLHAGVEIFEYRAGLLHAKIVTVDQQLAMIGSSNLDRRSFDLNYENNVLLEDVELARAIRARQSEYIKDSEKVLLSDVKNWSIPKRLWNNALAMLSPIL